MTREYWLYQDNPRWAETCDVCGIGHLDDVGRCSCCYEDQDPSIDD